MSPLTLVQKIIIQAINIAENARLDRPKKPPGSTRRRCGDVIRWKMNTATVDKIVKDLRRIYRLEEGKPSHRTRSAR